MYKNIAITGASGFVGRNLVHYLDNFYTINKIKRNTNLNFNEFAVVHLAGISHDIKNLANYQEYYDINTELSKKVFDAFLDSKSVVFIYLSSVKAVADQSLEVLSENCIPNPISHYGRSKLLAEEYIVKKIIPPNKKIFILRPCIIYGPEHKGNLQLLFKIVSKGIPWPLGNFYNMRSFCSIDNLIFVIKELIERSDIPSGVYNVADDDPISTNELIALIANSQNRNVRIWKISKILIKFIAKIGDLFRLPFNSETLDKLTESFVVSNIKLKKAIGKSLPVISKIGLLKTFQSFKKNDTTF